VPSTRVLLAQIDAELAEARRHHDGLEYSWAHAMYTAGCRGRRSPKEIDVDIARLRATIAALEDRREELASAPASVAPAGPLAAAPEPEFLDMTRRR
jgi:hypothetical protein